jgi:hypothetical protein
MIERTFAGTVGYTIALECVPDVTNASVAQILVRKPDRTKATWDAELRPPHRIQRVTADGDLDQPGIWRFRPYLELPGWKGRGPTTRLEVLA